MDSLYFYPFNKYFALIERFSGKQIDIQDVDVLIDKILIDRWTYKQMDSLYFYPFWTNILL